MKKLFDEISEEIKQFGKQFEEKFSDESTEKMKKQFTNTTNFIFDITGKLGELTIEVKDDLRQKFSKLNEYAKEKYDELEKKNSENTKEIDWKDVNEVKKVLYRHNPKAKICYTTKNGIVYVAEFQNVAIMFVVPLSDIGDAKFSPEMDSKLMIRYMSTVNPITDN